VKGIKTNNVTLWPELTPEIINKLLPTSVATVQGHIHQERKNLLSTKMTAMTPLAIEKIKNRIARLKQKMKPGDTLTDALKSDMDEDSFPPSPSPNTTTNDVMYIVIDKSETSTAFTDLTGCFPCKSSSGNEYVLVAYHYDGNVVMGQALKNRKAATITASWQTMQDTFRKAGAAPNTWVMNNEISDEFASALAANNVAFQLVPPHTHRRNLSERVIQTWKNHFKAGLASVDPKFPLSEWDRLIEQANITLN
jgi:hypothetical protein